MQQEGCSNCKYGELALVQVGGTKGGVHTSDKTLDMYICRYRRAQHYGHIMVADHWCIGYQTQDIEKSK